MSEEEEKEPMQKQARLARKREAKGRKKKPAMPWVARKKEETGI
jgi:hypothetical protein